jgi:hypothetical protein
MLRDEIFNKKTTWAVIYIYQMIPYVLSRFLVAFAIQDIKFNKTILRDVIRFEQLCLHELLFIGGVTS